MGGMAMMSARNRFREALKQKLRKTNSTEEKISIYEEAVSELLKIAGVDSVDIDEVTWYFADDPEDIDFPDSYKAEKLAEELHSS